MASAADKKEAMRLVEEAKALLEKGTTPAQKREAAQKALPLLEEAITLDPDNADAPSRRGETKNRLGEYMEAIANCDKAIKLNPKNVVALRNRAFAKNQTDDYQGAIADYNQALNIEPGDVDTLIERGRVKIRTRAYEEAIADFDEAVKIKGKNVEAWKYAKAFNLRGQANHNLDEYQKAIRDFDKAIAFDDSHAFTWNNRGLANYALRRFDDAIVDYGIAVELDSKNPKKNLQFGANKERAEYERSSLAREILRGEYDSVSNALRETQKARKYLLVFLAIVILVVCCLTGIFDILSQNGLGQNDTGAGQNDMGVVQNGTSEKEDGQNGFAILFATLPIASIIAIISTPIVWGIRICSRMIDDLTILKYDLFSRNNIEEKLFTDERFKNLVEDEVKKKIMTRYMENWMSDNPATRLIQHRQKAGRGNDPVLQALLKRAINQDKPDGQ